MKILVISDTHGRLENLKSVLAKEQPLDMILHLGDVCHDEEEIRCLAGQSCTVAYVRGNCDMFSSEPDTRDFRLGNCNIHMEHGHRLPSSLQTIVYKAQEIGADIMLSGHTHCPMQIKEGNVRIINPGSLERPRQSDGRCTYMIMNVDKDGEIRFKLEYAD